MLRISYENNNKNTHAINIHESMIKGEKKKKVAICSMPDQKTQSRIKAREMGSEGWGGGEGEARGRVGGGEEGGRRDLRWS